MRHQVGAAVAVAVVASLVYAGTTAARPAGRDDSPDRTPAGTATTDVRVMTWNVCGESGTCRAKSDPGRQATQIAELARGANTDAVLLQEVCGDEAKNDSRYDSGKTASKSLVTLVQERLGGDWRIAFTPYLRPAEDRFGTTAPSGPGATAEYPPRYVNPRATSEFRCRGAGLAGVQGLAVAVRGTIGERAEYELPSPDTGLWLKVLCARRATGTPVRFCTSHFTPQSQDVDRRAGFSYRAEQVQRLRELIGGGADTVFGGDFNSRPPDDPSNTADKAILAPLYAGYRECEQGHGGARRGTGTMWANDQPTKRTDRKYDYLFGAASFTSCEVLSATALATWSDHLPLVGTVPVTTPKIIAGPDPLAR
ncbi:endonuclease/exonuclease/phosphatase family protein [Actinoplanes sp. NPDC023936]|uniref:endonuclease/exonuclease/phosphatase family protein n=1 Tax=Actinoplanes sp. NPDC023936 TaxID=3154910 RepID=UPI00340CF845